MATSCKRTGVHTRLATIAASSFCDWHKLPTSVETIVSACWLKGSASIRV
jgi:hypothetical protein